ncbi:MAG TPA: SUF system NifU family Fe-S cluster assembly protein [Steroidobacteraceae bacterium]|nr:SUF system NifU family Fe-S cluster assembly protein [Steroidobacteraceae bacterium]
MHLQDLYRDVILDHNRNPRNFGALDEATVSLEGFNPLCGDRLTLRLRLVDDRLADIRFEGQGCAISTASASMMTEAVKGKTRAEALAIFGRVHRLLTDDAGGADADADLGKLAALSGVREFPARVKCASLCWHTLCGALQSPAAHTLPAVSTE